MAPNRNANSYFIRNRTARGIALGIRSVRSCYIRGRERGRVLPANISRQILKLVLRFFTGFLPAKNESETAFFESRIRLRGARIGSTAVFSDLQPDENAFPSFCRGKVFSFRGNLGTLFMTPIFLFCLDLFKFALR